MNPLLYLLFGLSMLAGGILSLVYLPAFRQRLRILTEARQINAVEAAYKLRVFIILIVIWIALGVVALLRFFHGPLQGS